MAEKGSSALKFYQGEAFLLIANRYPTLARVIYEQVQNCIDARPSNIWLLINKKSRNVVVRDNGKGVSKSVFETEIGKICEYKKTKGKLGRFSIGVISPLGKCTDNYFTSTTKSNPSGYIEWHFNTEKIKNTEMDVTIPFRYLDNIQFCNTGFKKRVQGVNQVEWRTEVKIINYTKDKELSRFSIESLRQDIEDLYGPDLRKFNIRVHIRVTNEDGTVEEDEFTGRQFTGRKLDEVILLNPAAGKVRFDLYVTERTAEGRKGRISFGELNDNFRLSAALVCRTCAGLISADIIDFLKSGYFEGEILAEKVSIIAERSKFKQDDALVGMCVAIEEWYQNVGQKHYTEVQESLKDDRYQRLGVRSMKFIERMLKEPRFASFLEKIKEFKKGTIGTHHAITDKMKIVGEQNEPSIANKGGAFKSREKTGRYDGTEQPMEERSGHVPLTVIGTDGTKRTIVRSNSTGIQFVHTIMRGNKLWEFDSATGILPFNLKHELWVMCEKNDNTLMKLQEYIVIHALQMLLMPDEFVDYARMYVDDSMETFVYWLLNADALTERRPVKKTRVPEKTEKINKQKPLSIADKTLRKMDLA